MKQIRDIPSYKNIDSKNSLNIDNNIDKGKYALKRGFSPNTEESATAREIAEALSDLKNFAFYFSAVKSLSPEIALQLLHETLDDVERRKKIGKPIKNPGAVYNWKVQRRMGVRNQK